MTGELGNDSILAFWAWFEGVAARFAEDFKNASLLDELDRRVASLGRFGWELGPGGGRENMLVISPDGDLERLATTLRIVAMAPVLPAWQFHAARPPRPMYEFLLNAGTGDEITVDASSWKYVLYQFREGDFDIVIEQSALQGISDDDRYAAAYVLLDGLLGEATRLRTFREVEIVDVLSEDQAKRATPMAHLPAHLQSLVELSREER